MKCKHCGANNGECRKTCCVCGEILEGYTINNVTGEYGYRGGDGLFYKSYESYSDKCKTENTPKTNLATCDKLIFNFGDSQKMVFDKIEGIIYSELHGEKTII